MEHEVLREKKKTVFVREGGCVLVRAEATWPEREGTEGEQDPFSGTYRRAAEAFLEWAEREVGERARAAFETAGHEGAHRFRRYGCRLTVTPEWNRDGGVTVHTEATLARSGEASPQDQYRLTQTWTPSFAIAGDSRRFLQRKIGKKKPKL